MTNPDTLDLPDAPEEAPSGALITPEIEVLMDDGRRLLAVVHNADYLRWDRTASKHKWGSFQTIPMTWVTFLAWSALRRTEAIPADMTWDEFSEHRAVGVQWLSSNGDTPTVDPTPSAVEDE